MHNIKPLHQATRADIKALAHAAAERDEPSELSNVFEPGTANYRAFELDYFEHRFVLGEPVDESAFCSSSIIHPYSVMQTLRTRTSMAASASVAQASMRAASNSSSDMNFSLVN